MASAKRGKGSAGRLLNENGSMQVYELETGIDSLFGSSVGSFDQTMVAFSETYVVVRVSRGVCEETPHISQVVLSRGTFLALLASYRAFERATQRRPAPVPDDYDPFLDPDELP